MAAVDAPETSTVPGTVFTPRQVRMLRLAVIVMGILLVGGFAFVLAAIVYQASHPAQVAKVSAGAGLTEGAPGIDVPVPGDASLAGIALDGNRLAIQLHGSAGPQIIVIDLGTGKIVAEVRLKPQ
jgi:hypothetical protein